MSGSQGCRGDQRPCSSPPLTALEDARSHRTVPFRGSPAQFSPHLCSRKSLFPPKSGLNELVFLALRETEEKKQTTASAQQQ